MATAVVEQTNEQEKNVIKRLFHKKTRSQQSNRSNLRAIGDYVLGDTLGMGGYSKVKLGIHKDTQRKVALKIMFGDESGVISDSKKKQLKRELNVMQQVKHRNVIELIEFHEDVEYPESNGTKKPCIVTVLEFAPGGELFDFLMFTGCFDEKATRTYFHQFINGLEAIHKAGIAHRDLKPENLLMDENFNLKIADFGFATEFKTEDGQQLMMATACGTKGYLAPELLKGKKYTEKCDLFAAGIILFTTYAGFPPFQNASDNDWWWDKLSKAWLLYESAKTTQDKDEKAMKELKSNEKFELFWKAHERSRKFPDELKDLSIKILHPDPNKRYGIPEVYAHSWYKGEIYDADETKKYMEKRIRSVMKERALKVKKQVEEQQLASSSQYPVRSGKGGLQNEIDKRAKILDPNDEFNKYLSRVDDNTFINTYHQFLTSKKPNEIAVRLERVANRLDAAVSATPTQQIVIIRCSIVFDGVEDDVVIAVKQLLFNGQDSDSNDDVKQNDSNVNKDNDNTNTKEQYLVAFKRLQGSPFAYKKVVEEYYSAPEITEVMDIDNDI